MLVLLFVAADWNAWYEAQVKLRSMKPSAEQTRVLTSAWRECEKGDLVSCAYMLSVRTYELKALSYAVEQVIQACYEGNREICEAALKIADKFHIVYHDHTLATLRAAFPQEVYKSTCLRFDTACKKLEQLPPSEEEAMLIQIRQGADVAPNEAAVKALARECGEGVAQCRLRDMTFFRKDCPSGPYCFVAAYDAFLRGGASTQESELFAVLGQASKATPAAWLTDVKTAQCVRKGGCEKELGVDAVSKLNVYLSPATAIVVNDLVEKRVAGNPKLAEAMAKLESKRAEFSHARKQRSRDTIKAQLPSPRTAPQSAMYALIQEREAEIASAVARYEN